MTAATVQSVTETPFINADFPARITNGEALSIEFDLNLPNPRVVHVLDRILAEWAEKHAVKLEFIQPGNSRQKAFIEHLTELTVQQYSIIVCSGR